MTVYKSVKIFVVDVFVSFINKVLMSKFKSYI